MAPKKDDPKKTVTVVCIYCGQEFVGDNCPNAAKTDHDKDGPKFRKCGDCKSAAPITGECPTCEKRRKEEAERLEKQDERSARLEEERHKRLIALESEKLKLEKERDKIKADRDSRAEKKRHERIIALESEKLKLEKEREETRRQAEMQRTTNFVHCKSCGFEFPITDGFCKHCIKKCTVPTCGHLYSKDLPECPRCTLPRKYDFRVDIDRDDANSRWELKVFLFRQIGYGKAEAANNVIVSLNDPLEPSIRLTVRPDGTPVHPNTKPDGTIEYLSYYLKYSEKSREVSFSLISSDDGNINVEPKKIPLAGRPCKPYKTKPVETNSWWQDFVRTLKGE